MLVLGLACGLFATWALRTIIRAVLTLNSQHDAAAIGGVAALFAAIALLSAFIPARRAAIVEPMESLRTE